MSAPEPTAVERTIAADAASSTSQTPSVRRTTSPAVRPTPRRARAADQSRSVGTCPELICAPSTPTSLVGTSTARRSHDEQRGPVKEYPSITLPYRLWEHEDHDLLCEDCGQVIRHGQPYVSRITGVYENGDTLAELRCVYCGTPGPVEVRDV